MPAEPEGLETQCQAEALGTLMYLDEKLGTTYAQRFLGEGGLWECWPGSPGEDLAAYTESIRDGVVFAAGGNPGWRGRMKQVRRAARS